MPLNYCSIGYSEHENEMLQDAERAIETAGMWEYMKTEPGEGGYMYGDDPELKAIYQHIKYEGHSGSSMGGPCAKCSALRERALTSSALRGVCALPPR